MARILWKLWVLKAYWWVALGWAFTLAFILLVSTKANALVALAVLCLILAFVSGVTSAIVSVATYSTTERFLRTLILQFLSVILLFANLYFVMQVWTKGTALEGLQSPWFPLGGLAGWTLTWQTVLHSILDSVHFSIVTIATLGDGAMRPAAWFAKLAVDTEVLLGAGLLVVGFGRYFAQAAIRTENREG